MLCWCGFCICAYIPLVRWYQDRIDALMVAVQICTQMHIVN
jgi:hypothetical protein